MALIKYLEFGGTDYNTGEKRVTLLDNQLIKTASNEIQDYWNDLVRKPDCFYLHVIAMSAGEYWGPNRRADWYGEENLKKYHELFVTQAKVYKHHINKPDSPSYGRVLYSYYNDNMHRVELILEVDKKGSQEYVDKIKRGEDIYVSMGMRVPRDECSVCGNIATRLDEYCEHGKHMKNKILDDDRLVYRINHAPYNLFDISLVTRPADPVAWAMEKAASYNSNIDASDTIAVYDDDTFNTINLLKVAVDKFADLIKEVELSPIDSDVNDEDDDNEDDDNEDIIEDDDEIKQKYLKKLKGISAEDGSPTITKLRIFIRNNRMLPEPIKFPSMSFSELDNLCITPSVPIISALLDKVHLSLDELAYYIGKIYLGKLFTKKMRDYMLCNIPYGVHRLQEDPMRVITSLIPIATNFSKIASDDELDNELTKLASHTKNTYETIYMLKFAGLTTSTTPYNQPDIYETRVTKHDRINNIVELVNKYNPNDVYIARAKDSNKYLAYKDLNFIDSGVRDKFIGAVTALAGVTSLLTGKSEKALLGIPAIVIGGLLLSKDSNETGKKYTASDFQFIEKKAGIPVNASKIMTLKNAVPALGIGIPAALAADYMYINRKVRNNPEVVGNMSRMDNILYSMGENVTKHPVLATTATLGGMGLARGAIKTQLMKRKLRKYETPS